MIEECARDRLVPEVEIVGDPREKHERGIRERALPERDREERAERERCEQERHDGTSPDLPRHRPIRKESRGEERLDQRVERDATCDGDRRPQGPPRRELRRARCDETEEIRGEHPAAEEIERSRQLIDLMHDIEIVCDEEPVRVRDDEDRGEREPRSLHRRPTHEGEDRVELDLGRERPQHAVDRPVRIRKERVDEEQMQCHLPHRVRRRIEFRPAERDHRRDREHVRGQDLDRAAVGEGRHTLFRRTVEQRPRVRIEQAESADEKEQIDADKAVLGNPIEVHRCGEHVDVGGKPRDLPDVKPHDERDGDAAQAVERCEVIGRLRARGTHTARNSGLVNQTTAASTRASEPPQIKLV